jgi:hypothetical protein
VAAREHFRALSRRPTRGAGSLIVTASGLPNPQPVKVVDLGLGGACLEVSDLIPPGTAVRLSLEAPNRWEPLVLDGRVVWTRDAKKPLQPRLGMKFEKASSGTLRALVDLLEAEAYE